MSSRLDRLFVLLDTGSSPVVRRSAALQLGEVQRLHPHKLTYLLQKLLTYLRSNSWESRIAAGAALEAIAKNVPLRKAATPKSKDLHKADEPGDSEVGAELGSVTNLIEKLDIHHVLALSSSLLGTETGKYETPALSAMSEIEVRLHQKRLLNKKLGLDLAPALGMEVGSLVTDEDLSQHIKAPSPGSTHGKESISNVFMREIEPAMSTSGIPDPGPATAPLDLSVRSRKVRRGVGKQTSILEEPASPGRDEVLKKMKTESVAVEQPGQPGKILVDTVISEQTEEGEWPFHTICDVLLNDLFSSQWEIRHGAATGLREIIKIHGGNGGVDYSSTPQQMKKENQVWLQEVTVRLLCVIAIDRFGDYVSDEVVAPVRETCAQALGVVSRVLDEATVMSVLKVLLTVCGRPEWEVRYSSLLAIKCLVAVREDLMEELLRCGYSSILTSLQDSADDVRGVAAACLLPAASRMHALLPDKMPELVTSLWDALLQLDDLSSSTGSVMGLLSALLTALPQQTSSDQPTGNRSMITERFEERMPRLWPLLTHTIHTVRGAALQAMKSMLLVQGDSMEWIGPVLLSSLRYMFQLCLTLNDPVHLQLASDVWNLLVERSPSAALWSQAIPCLNVWVCLAMQPPLLPFDPALFLFPQFASKQQQQQQQPVKRTDEPIAAECVQQAEPPPPPPPQVGEVQTRPWCIGGDGAVTATDSERDSIIMEARYAAARCVAVLIHQLMNDTTQTADTLAVLKASIQSIVEQHLASKAACHRIVIGFVLIHWASLSQSGLCKCDGVLELVTRRLSEIFYYDEVGPIFTGLQKQAQNYIVALKEQGVPLQAPYFIKSVLTIDEVQTMVRDSMTALDGQAPPSVTKNSTSSSRSDGRQSPSLKDSALLLSESADRVDKEQQRLHTRVQLVLACTLSAAEKLPERLTTVIKPMMDTIRREEIHRLQDVASRHLSAVMQLALSRHACPNAKVIKNLCSLACSSEDVTPNVSTVRMSDEVASCDNEKGIISLIASKCSAQKKKRGPRKTDCISNANGHTASPVQVDSAAAQQTSIQLRGSRLALRQAAISFGSRVGEDLPSLLQHMVEPLTTLQSTDVCQELTGEIAQSLVNSLQVLEVVFPHLSLDSGSRLLSSHLPSLVGCLRSHWTAVRHMTARSIAAMAMQYCIEVMAAVVEDVMPMLGESDDVAARSGAIELIYLLLEGLYIEVVPYIALLSGPVLARMSDQNPCVQRMASLCFASLVTLMPLEAGVPDPAGMGKELSRRRLEEREFLNQLFGVKKVDTYSIPIPVKTELRKYQQDGVNWLAFLNKYQLHGILCDDMGLGKTLQAICIVAGDNQMRAQEFEKTHKADKKPLPSLVICPPTLTGHWVYEIEKFVDGQYLKPLNYIGSPHERSRLQKTFHKYNLIVASFDIVRNDIDFFKLIHWNYCVMDEGHILKNVKSKTSQAIRQLSSNHRLMLTGTPLQNNVLELWSLFDVLMPGYMGTEKQFHTRYSRPILTSREAKSTSKEQEAGALAIESLHKQVLPFILRRLKEDVLQDLPPKIIQDYYCELTPLQSRLYKDFSKSSAGACLEQSLTQGENEANKGHVFQSLQYLKKVCNHPSLVLTPSHPEYGAISAKLRTKRTTIESIEHSSKLVALRQLLADCGVGGGDCCSSSGADGQSSAAATSSSSSSSNMPVVNQHRVLIFCQLKKMLDIIEKDLLGCMPSVSYLRLDGSVPADSRHGLVSQFNNDPSIDILLLTTAVGGLGLNLTGADTVVFVEHDWNPMKDLQAMDRAHRIGQKKVVNVYRLITKDTLEEKIMGLQKFKLNIANTVVNQENSGLSTMGMDQLLNLFTLDPAGDKTKDSAPQRTAAAAPGTTILKDILAAGEGGAGELGTSNDPALYESEYNLDGFVKSLK